SSRSSSRRAVADELGFPGCDLTAAQADVVSGPGLDSLCQLANGLGAGLVSDFVSDCDNDRKRPIDDVEHCHQAKSYVPGEAPLGRMLACRGASRQPPRCSLLQPLLFL